MIEDVDVQPFIDAIVDALEANTKAKLDDYRYVGQGWWFDASKKLLKRGKARFKIETLRDGTITFVDGETRIRRRPDGSWLVRRNGRYQKVSVDDDRQD